MLTKRETQLLELIEEMPEITQNELAKRCGITRSSVAVHISNLMKKGVITGKGYIVRNKPYILVVGGQNIDIYGRPRAIPTRNDSTPGSVRITEGGVGRNIAVNLALLGEEVKLVTVFGGDHHAEQLAASARRLGVDISHSLTVQEPTSTYLLIMGANGDIEMSVADMDIYDQLSPEFLAGKQKVIARAGACVADTDLPADTLEWLAANCRSPLFLRTVSTHKAARAAGIIGKAHAFAPNLAEAEVLYGRPISGIAGLRGAARHFLGLGAKQVYIMMGADGVYATDGTAETELHGIKVRPQNTVGTQDSFVAGLVWAWLQNFNLEESALAAAAAADICMLSEESVNLQITEEALRAEMQRLTDGALLGSAMNE
ncbi:PfkB family carbohydrate kinase [Ruminococcaceae bacterium OttesenSCG-928-D13]|nr:PfkB family carbohydrate kinase [Ruminococcaceae bacterium OttesenSCG-928-D13]